MKKLIIITGSKGFIGFELFKKLAINLAYQPEYKNDDYQIFLVDKENTDLQDFRDSLYADDQRVVNFINDNVTVYALDLTVSKAVFELYKETKGFDTIDLFHFAAVVGVPNWNEINANKSYKINNLINCNIKKYFNKKKVHIYFSSTSEVYGDNSCANEDVKFFQILQNPRGLYSLEKIEFENYLRYIFKGDYTIFRFFNVCGKTQSPKNGVISKIADCYKTRRIFTCTSRQYRAFIYVTDAVECVYHLFKEKVKGIFNIGNPNNYYRIDQIVKLFDPKLENIKLFEQSDYDNGIKDRKPNIDRLTFVLGKLKIDSFLSMKEIVTLMKE